MSRTSRMSQTSPMSRRRYVRVAALSELPVGEGRLVRVSAAPVALFRRTSREVLAIQGRCPHAGGPLADGILAGDSVICPLHGWKINVESCGYPVELRDGDVYVCVPEGS